MSHKPIYENIINKYIYLFTQQQFYKFNDLYLLSVQSRTGTLIGYAHAKTTDATELIIWRDVERISLTLVTQIAGCIFLIKNVQTIYLKVRFATNILK